VSLGSALDRALAGALGSPVVRSSGVSGGDINQAHQIALADGRELFVKTNARAPAAMFPAEARGIAWLGAAGALRVPEVVAVSPAGGGGGGVHFLVLELIERGRPARDFDETLGRGLAALHRFGAPSFGLDHDNFIGRLPQANSPISPPSPSTWEAFYRERRLAPQLRLAAERGLASAEMVRGFERLFARMSSLLEPERPPARLHGDLWGGNLMCDAGGAPCLIDPAVYGGSREIDLAMMRLFGGFGPRVFAAYEEAWPLDPGYEERVDLYQLYPLMVHVNLFGGGYVGSVESALGRLI
jgi:protein-ribulosamine 3-kinase